MNMLKENSPRSMSQLRYSAQDIIKDAKSQAQDPYSDPKSKKMLTYQNDFKKNIKSLSRQSSVLKDKTQRFSKV